MPHAAKTYRARPRVENRPSSAQRGYDKRWMRLRNAYAKANPWCQDCLREGRHEFVDEVDHVLTVHERPDLRLEWSNLSGLCRKHHAAKTIRDMKRGATR